MLTEPEAWREVARRWVDRKEGWVCGTCPMLQDLYYDRLITLETVKAMHNRIRFHLDGRFLAYGWEVTRAAANKYREARALAALWLALEAEEEGA